MTCEELVEYLKMNELFINSFLEVLKVVAVLILSYMVVRLVSSAIFRSYFANINKFKKKEKKNESKRQS